MKATAQALKTFVGGFGLPAYTKESVPKDVTAPYLVYPLVEPEWDKKATFYIQGWYRTTSNVALTAKADQIIQEIGAGITLKTASGYLVIYPESPLVQIETSGDYRYFYINLAINAYQMPGYFPEPPPTPDPVDPVEPEEPGEEDEEQPGTNPEEGENEDAET